MSETTSTAAPAAARPARSSTRRTSVLRQALIIAVAVVVGGLAGLVYALMPPVNYTASALVDAGPAATAADALDVAPDAAERFVQTELVYLGQDNAAIAAQAAQQAGLDSPPTLAAREVATTTVVEIFATAPSQDDAAAAANAAAAIYSDAWRARSTAGIDQSLAAIEKQLVAVSARLAALPAEGGTPAEQAQRGALQSELDRLATLQAETQFDRAAVQAADRVVAQADAASAVRTRSLLRSGFVGAVLGLMAGVGIVVLIRRRETAPSAQSWPG